MSLQALLLQVFLANRKWLPIASYSIEEFTGRLGFDGVCISFQVLEMQAASKAVLRFDIGPISTSQLQVIFPDQGASEVAMVASQLGRSPTSAIT